MRYIYLAPRLDLTVSFHHEHFIVPISCPGVSEDEPHEGLAACIAKTLGAIHSTRIPTGPTWKSGPPRWTRFFETFPVGPNRSIEFWTEISGNFGSRGFAPPVSIGPALLMEPRTFCHSAEYADGFLAF